MNKGLFGAMENLDPFGGSTTADPRGNKGKGLGTTGDSTRWENFGIKTAPPVAGALTGGNSYHALMADVAYVLPDFTDSQTFGLASLTNSAAVPTTVMTSDGWTLAPTLTANTFKAVAPTSTATAHGTWGALSQTPPAAATLTAAAAPTIVGTLQLSTDVLLILYTTTASTAAYVVALNTATNTFGTPVSLGVTASVSPGPYMIYADSATNFVVAFGTPTLNVICGSVAGLVITFGAAVVGTYSYGNGLLQLTQGLYVSDYGSSQCEVFTTSGTLVSKGPNTSITAISRSRLIRLSNNSFLAAGAVATSSPTTARFIVVTVAGATPTPGTAVDAATAVILSETPRFLRSLSEGGPFIICYRDNAVATTGDYYGVTVTGTTPTIGAVLALANTIPALAIPPTYKYIPANDGSLTAVVYNTSTLLVGSLTGLTALTIAGTTLSSGATFTAANGKVAVDMATGLNFYGIGTATDKITVAGTVITSSQQVAIVPQIISSATLTNKAVSYAASWYSWTLPSLSVAATLDKWLGVSGSNIILYGPIA